MIGARVASPHQTSKPLPLDRKPLSLLQEKQTRATFAGKRMALRPVFRVKRSWPLFRGTGSCPQLWAGHAICCRREVRVTADCVAFSGHHGKSIFRTCAGDR